MRGKRMIVCLCVVAWGVATAGVVAGEKSGLRSARSATLSVDPDGPPIMALESPGSIAGGTGGCDAVGAFVQPFSGTNRFRGVVYRMTRNATLLEFKMQLRFSGTTDLYLSIHRAPSGQQLADFERVLPDVVLRDVFGEGAAVFYNSGVLDDPTDLNPAPGGLKLQAGFDYAIGITWGGSASVTYARDQQVYPLPFSQGSVLGLVAVSGAPPLDDVVSSLSVFGSNGVYAQELCFAGACCLPDGTCAEMDLDACPGQRTSTGVTCDDVFAEGGCRLPDSACCTAPNSCAGDVNRFLCEGSGGVSRNGVSCGDPFIVACAPRGGCCLPDEGLCAEDVTEARCGLLRGRYRGDGVLCTASPLCSAGACCRGDDCTFEFNRSECEDGQFGGVFAGPGVACSPNPCAPSGACCLPTTCADDLTESDCVAQGGNYRGDDTVCDTIVPKCGLGACCEPGVGCTDGNPPGRGIESATCAILGGNFLGDGTTCAQDAWGCEGTCCRNAPLCNDLVTPQVCDAQLGGSFVGYDLCSTGACGDVFPAGACCLPGGLPGLPPSERCTTTTNVAICEDVLNGTFSAGVACSAVDCTPAAPTGACCTGTGVSGTCVDGVVEIDCLGGWTEGAGCLDVPSPCEVRGACCDQFDPNNPFCSDDVLEGSCQNVGESFTANTACADLFPPCEPTGACCDVNVFQCLDDVVADACRGAGRTWTEGVACVELPRPCVPPGACCLDTPGTCANLFEDECTGAGEVFGGSGTDCFPIPCLTIVATNPADCGIDARQPVNVDGSAVNGSDGIDIMFDGSARGLGRSDFMVESFPGVEPTPEIVSVLPGDDANSVRVVFNAIMVTQDWTCVTHLDSGQRTCVGFLPADADGSRLVEPPVVDNTDPTDPQLSSVDVTAVAECSDSTAACGVWSCDTDRSGSCTPADILREIDLLNRAGSLGVSIDKTIDSCPIATTP